MLTKLLIFLKITIFRSSLNSGRRRDGCSCCIILPDDYKSNECGQKSYLQLFYGKIVEPGVVKLPVKVYQLPYRFQLHHSKYMHVMLHNFQVKPGIKNYCHMCVFSVIVQIFWVCKNCLVVLRLYSNLK